MRRRRRRSAVPWVFIVFLSAALAVAIVVLWRIYPEYRRLSAEGTTPPQVTAPPDSSTVAEPIIAHLYVARMTEGRQRMVAVPRELPAEPSPARAALEELIRGEVPRDCDRPLPPGTRVLTCEVANGVATVNFSEELVSGFRGGSENEQVKIYAIVNTLTSLSGIEEVQILVEGRRPEVIGGHYDLSDPLTFDNELVAPYL